MPRDGTEFELSERKKEILFSAVGEYIEKAIPITSGGIASTSAIDVSSATLRNELNALEQMGFLKQLHTSGGRVPTTKGYRYFVNSITKECSCDVAELAKIKNIFEKRTSNLSELVFQVASKISEVTNYPTVVFLNGFEKLKVESIKIIPLITNEALMLIQTSSGMLNNTINISKGIDEQSCIDAGRFLTQKFANLTIEQMLKAIQESHAGMQSEILEYREFFDYVLQTLVHLAKEFKEQNAILSSGATKLLNNPEYTNVEKAKEVLHILDDAPALKKVFENSVDSDDISFSIGDENANVALEDCTIARANYKVDGESIASIGVFGPKRMDYAKISGALKFVVDEFKKTNMIEAKLSSNKKDSETE